MDPMPSNIGETIKDGSKCTSYKFLKGTAKETLQEGTCININNNTFDTCTS